MGATSPVVCLSRHHGSRFDGEEEICSVAHAWERSAVYVSPLRSPLPFLISCLSALLYPPISFFFSFLAVIRLLSSPFFNSFFFPFQWFYTSSCCKRADGTHGEGLVRLQIACVCCGRCPDSLALDPQPLLLLRAYRILKVRSPLFLLESPIPVAVTV